MTSFMLALKRAVWGTPKLAPSRRPHAPQLVAGWAVWWVGWAAGWAVAGPGFFSDARRQIGLSDVRRQIGLCAELFCSGSAGLVVLASFSPASQGHTG